MKPIRFSVLTALLFLLAPLSSWAVNTVLSNVFDGTEAKTSPLPGSCGGDGLLAYQASTTFQVSASGSYLVVDAFNVNGVDVTALIYQGGFDPANPQNNLVTLTGVDGSEFVDLTAGVPYTLVVQQWCQNFVEGAWSVTFSGPGSVTSPDTRTVPAYTEGVFSSGDPVADTDCTLAGVSSYYQEEGPVQVSTAGTYYYTDIFTIDLEVDICMLVYSAPFDPANPQNNLVGTAMDDYGSVDLASGQDYYFVVQPLGSSADGLYFYVLAPPADFRINKALAGGWFNGATPGQGLFFDIYDDRNQMFAGWYTFDLSRPVDGTAELGEPGHRWLTAFGTVNGAVADLDVYLAAGGVFDASDPPIGDQTIVGSMTVEFSDCMVGSVDYSLTAPAVSGQFALEPLADSHVELCEFLTDGPGMPGPL